MSEVCHLNQFRRRIRKEFLAQHQRRIDQLVQDVVKTTFAMDFHRLCTMLEVMRNAASNTSAAMTWDHLDLRDMLYEVAEGFLREQLELRLEGNRWLDRRVISIDELIERCFSEYILAASAPNFAPLGTTERR